jgi:hypothetical protein
LSPTTWISIGLGGIIVALGVYIVFLKISVNITEVQLDEYKARLEACKIESKSLAMQRDNCVADIHIQNNAVNTMIEESAKLQQNLNDAVADNMKKNKQLRDIIKDINTKQVPKDCAGAMTELKSFANNYAKEWNK